MMERPPIPSIAVRCISCDNTLLRQPNRVLVAVFLNLRAAPNRQQQSMAHTPGKGHRRKSDPIKKRRFRRAAARNKVEAEWLLSEAVARWALMTEEQRKFLPELHPDNFRL